MKFKKCVEYYIAIAALVILVVVFGVQSMVRNNQAVGSQKDGEELKQLQQMDYIAYESYGDTKASYSVLSSGYAADGMKGTEASIILTPKAADTAGEGVLQTGIADFDGEALVLRENVNAQWTFDVKEAGLYSIVLDYAGIDGDGAKIQRQILIDGELPCAEATNVCFYRYFVESGDVKINEIGDEVWPTQTEVLLWQTQAAFDSYGYHPEPMYFYFSEGKHTVSLNYVDQPMAVREVRLEGKKEIPAYQEMLKVYESKGYKKVSPGAGQHIEGEESAWRSDSIIRRESNNDPETVPFSLYNRVLNTVGGNRWNRGEQSVSWNFQVEEAGLYEVAVKTLQGRNEGMPSYRKVEIDGEVPFQEFLEYKFPYNKNWYGEVLSDESGEPYLVYLEPGVHEITLTAQLGPISSVIERTTNDISVLSEITRDITKITGTEPDPNYEYDLYRLMPELSGELDELADSIEVCADILAAITNKTTSTENSYRAIIDTLRNFSEDVDRIPRALSELENAQTNMGSYITSLKVSPLQIDYLEIKSPEEEFVVKNSNFFQKFYVSTVNFLMSFVKDYDAVGTTKEDGENVVLDVWIGRGSEWGEILKEMIDEDFTPKTGIYVNLNVMPSSQLTTGGVNVLMLSINSGTAPDVALSVDYNLPSEFAFRGASVDLTQFDDYKEVESWFYDNSMVPYVFRDGVYALPETMDFTVMYYRKDLMRELGLELPETWTQLYTDILPKLYENNMSFNLSVDTSVSSSSPAALRGFTMMLLQNGGSYYTPNGKQSALGTAQAYQAFKSWTDLYSQYEVDEESNLFTRMRTGATPLGVAGYTEYIQFLTSAPELYGRWGVTAVPGIANPDGTVSRETGSVSKTANLILSQSDKQEASWEFLKWWMSEDTQVNYGRQLEAVIGESARWNTANVDAFFRLPWKTEDKLVIQATLEDAQEQYIVPGGYFTSRHLINAWNRVVINDEKARDALEEAVKDINKELDVKIEEFGLQAVDVIPQEGRK